MRIFLSPLKLLLPLLLLPTFSLSHAAEAVSNTSNSNKLTCQGKMLNPINDICWSCMFPIKIGGSINLNYSNQEDNKSTPNDWFCACSKPTRAGVTVSFWEPTHLVEVVRTPFCMVSLGGISLKKQKVDASETADKADTSNKIQKLFGGAHKRGRNEQHEQHNAFYQVHWYKNPVVFWLEALLDNDCIRTCGFTRRYADSS